MTSLPHRADAIAKVQKINGITLSKAKNLQKRVQKFDSSRILSRRIKGKMHFSLNLLLQNLEDKRKIPIFAASEHQFWLRR